ncbi:MAG: alpha/beta hydrolase [Rubrivivax sp.]|nr:alpha/beta hydrolase [Rubrivivax sp.]
MAAPDTAPRTLVFSHANGFPAGTYRVLFEAWRAAGWRVLALPKFGHDARFPVTSSWPRVRDELLAFIDEHAPRQRVCLVGHSLGGYLSLLAGARRPGLAEAIVLLDSPVLGGWKAHSVHVFKLTGAIRRVSPGRVSQSRRERWPSAAAALAHFQGKRAFAVWDPRVLADYIAAGTEPDPDDASGTGVRLAFRREVETRFYNTLPHQLATTLGRHPPGCPVAYVAGSRSAEGRTVGLATTRALTHGRIRTIEGSHLVPMEQPELTAATVLELLAEMTPSADQAVASS